MIGRRSSILRQTLSGVLVCLLLPAGAFAQNTQNANETRVKEQALAIPLGWPVQVRFNNGDRLHGRMGQITDQGLVVQSITAGKIEERTIAFTDVKKITHGPPVSTKRIVAITLLYVVIFGAEIGYLAAR